MQHSRLLEIYPTSRALRESIKDSHHLDSLLPKKITIAEFLQRATLIQDRVYIDEDRRKLLLREACRVDKLGELGIDREFFRFLKNSQVLFRFFEELAVEKVDIDTLEMYDIYASYEEHIAILKEVLSNYEKILEERGFVDKITLPKLSRLNSSYLENFDEIVLYLEGYLTNFEFDLFCEIAKKVNFTFRIITIPYNKKMLEKLYSLGFALEIGYQYHIKLSDIKVISKKPLEKVRNSIKLFTANSRLMQVAFVKKALFDMLQKGLNPEKIAVITPDSSFTKLLKLMDDENNFNLAMGHPFEKTKIYKELSALYNYTKEPNIQNSHRLDRLGFDKEAISQKVKIYSTKLNEDEIINELESFTEGKEERELEIYLEELHNFKRVLPTIKDQPFLKILHLFLSRLKERSLDDVTGGKVTVMEILESRGISYDGVIIVDFNEGVVPAISQKDLFLSSQIRERASLPTTKDRESLQKYYYKRLIDSAKEVYISYVEDDQNSPSRFIDELELKAKPMRFTPKYHDILLKRGTIEKPYLPESIVMKYDFQKCELSASRLKTFLECPRKYYFRYIKRFQDAQIPTDVRDEREVGVVLHLVLKEIYSTKSSYEDSDELYRDLQRALYQKSEGDTLFRYHIDIWLERLKAFAINEVERFREGYRVAYCEKRLSCDYHGFKLIGDIDRIDMREGRYSVIDYKSGKIPDNSLNKTVDFQLQFYHLLSKELGELEGCYYYELKSGKLREEKSFDEKLELLDEKLALLKEGEFDFHMCEDKSVCRFCPYNKLCQRSV